MQYRARISPSIQWLLALFGLFRWRAARYRPERHYMRGRKSGQARGRDRA